VLVKVAQISSSVLSDEQRSVAENPQPSLLKSGGLGFTRTAAAACQLTVDSIKRV